VPYQPRLTSPWNSQRSLESTEAFVTDLVDSMISTDYIRFVLDGEYPGYISIDSANTAPAIDPTSYLTHLPRRPCSK